MALWRRRLGELRMHAERIGDSRMILRRPSLIDALAMHGVAERDLRLEATSGERMILALAPSADEHVGTETRCRREHWTFSGCNTGYVDRSDRSYRLTAILGDVIRPRCPEASAPGFD